MISDLLRLTSCLLWEHGKIGFSFPDDARKGWPRRQAVEISRKVSVAVAEWHHLVGIEQRRRRRAISDAERLAHRPGLAGDVLVDHAVAGLQPRPCFIDTVRIFLSFRPQPVADDFLHR